jgi:chromosome segregation ATPase
MVARHARKTQRSAAAQLTLPGTVPEPPSVQQRLEYALAHIQEQDVECTELRQYITELRAELREVQTARLAAVSDRLKADNQLREAKSQILVLQTMSDGLIDLLRQRTQEAPPVDQTWLLKEVTRLLTVCHPDKWQGSAVAEELTKEVLAVRQRLQGTGTGRKGARP